MMSPRRRALWVDFSLGGGAILFGVLARGAPTSLESLLIAGTGLFTVLTALYVAEHTQVLALVNRTRPMSLVLACAMFTAVGVALIVGQGVVATPSATLLFGVGVGFVLYRVRFGVTGPLPARRLEQARLWGSPPKRQRE